MERFAGIARELSALSGLQCAPAPERSVAGGSINECYAWRCALGLLFVKVCARGAGAAFEAESRGLAELARARAIRVPEVIACGEADTAAFLALEWIESQAPDARSEERLGEELAALHTVTATRFGLHHDNLIGSTPQANGWTSDWAAGACSSPCSPGSSSSPPSAEGGGGAARPRASRRSTVPVNSATTSGSHSTANFS